MIEQGVDGTCELCKELTKDWFILHDEDDGQDLLYLGYICNNCLSKFVVHFEPIYHSFLGINISKAREKIDEYNES